MTATGARPVRLVAAGSYGAVVDTAYDLSAARSAAEREEFFAGTARRWYHLEAEAC